MLGVVALALNCLPAALRAQSAGAGTIVGQIMNAGTQVPLVGALVSVEGFQQVNTLTGADGRFRLTNVPAGTRTLVVDYTGLDTGRLAVSVGSGGVTQASLELTAPIYQMDAFSISAEREGQAAATNRQRMADNVVNVVSIDAYGSIADTNVGNLLVKLPGISPVRTEGEVIGISIRGMDPTLNMVSVDGTLLAGANTGGTGRNFEINKFPTNSLESIEVIKSPTPDMDADSIGGTINFKTRSAFDRKGRELHYSAGANIYPQREIAHPSTSVIYTDILGADRRLGVALSGAYNRTFSPRLTSAASYLNPTLTAPASIATLTVQDDDRLLDRLGTNARFDYKLNDSTTLFFNTIYNNFRDRNSEHTMLIRVQGSQPPAGQLIEVSDHVTAFNNGQFAYEMVRLVRTVKTWMFQTGGKTELANFKFDYDGSHSRSHSTEKRHNLSLRVNRTGYRFDRTQRFYFPTYTQISGPDITNYDNAFTENMDQRYHHAWDRVSAGKLNAKREFNSEWLSYLKAGVRYRGQEKRADRLQDIWRYGGPDGVSGTNPATGINDDNLNRFRGDGHTVAPVGGRYPALIWPHNDNLHDVRRQSPELFVFNATQSLINALSSDREAREKIYAAYLMGDFNLGKLSAVTGVRVERTETWGESMLRDRSKPTTLGQYGGRQQVEGSYTNTFPGLHLKYEAAPRFLLRASASTSVGRPDFSLLGPGTDVDTSGMTIRQNNPSLLPQFSQNFDVSAEYYFKRVGLASITAFKKNITDFPYSTQETVGGGAGNGFDGQYEGFTLMTNSNGGWARVQGVELNYYQQLTFLPGFFNGFGLYANLTLLKTKGNYGGTAVLDNVAGFVKRTGNIGLSYIKHDFTVRASLHHVGGAMIAYNADEVRRTYQEPRDTVDISFKYNFRPRLSVFVEGFNVLNEQYVRYIGLRHRPITTELYGARMSAGISGEF